MNDRPLKQIVQRELNDLDHLTTSSGIESSPLMCDEQPRQPSEPEEQMKQNLETERQMDGYH